MKSMKPFSVKNAADADNLAHHIVVDLHRPDYHPDDCFGDEVIDCLVDEAFDVCGDELYGIFHSECMGYLKREMTNS